MTAYMQVHSALDRIKKDKTENSWPVALSDRLCLVDFQNRKQFKDRYPITFMKSPDASLIKSRELLIEMLGRMPFVLSEKEKREISMNVVMLTFLLSSSELKDAKEILYNIYQFAQRFPVRKNTLKALHIGGGNHAKTIEQILKSQMQNPDVMKIFTEPDPRFADPLLEKGIYSFIHETVPTHKIIEGIKAEGFEVYANPKYIVDTAEKAIRENLEEFEKRVLVRRLLTQMRFGKSLSSAQKLNREHKRLSSLGIAELRKLCPSQ